MGGSGRTTVKDVLPRFCGISEGVLVLEGPWPAVQHVTLPLVFGACFLRCRLPMFVPSALHVGAVVSWR